MKTITDARIVITNNINGEKSIYDCTEITFHEYDVMLEGSWGATNILFENISKIEIEF